MFQKHNLKKIALLALLSASFAACKKDAPDPDDHDHDDHGKEFKYVRVLVADENSTKITQIDPAAGALSSFDGKFPLASLYATASGRYAAVLYGANNLVEVFDTGLQSHEDHVDVANNPKWAAITASGIRPTHFKSDGAESLIFNDGEGTLSVASEADFNTPGARFSTINAGLTPHHGAMAQFTNGTYAVTKSAAAGASPTRVIVISKSGAQVHASTLETGAIHGNATDGSNAVFGAFTNSSNTAGGALVVRQTGEQRLIPNPDGFGAFRLGTILYAKAAKKFIGYAANKGAYLIDLVNNRMSAIYTGTDAIQCKTDYAGRNLLVLTLDGKLRIYDLATGTLKKEGQAITATPAADTYKPVLEATGRFAYVAVPSTGEVHQINLENFETTKHKVSARPVRLAVLGFESSESHDH
ncbi:hypothetical protein C7T94_07700 [Pedobacter yulinensis]|uniref:Uncharacterized protein n=1 Tax=Pedobacter yulinensis TaxID=2126353 RepID=A0A2T3HJD1_9SPHI|nr:hypothetical protein [Pedobacter yulinensis]PST82547.1 hypothetical protein C7T94_07700 [Pedobacter yulinensis]